MQNSIKAIIKSGALTELNPVIKELFEKLPHAALICDSNTYEAAGKKIERDYKGTLDLIILGIKDEILMPEEPSIGEIFLKVSDKTELLIACGSGVINDITRFAAYKLKKTFISIATACSMDGYASTISPLVLNNLKRSYPALPPKVILADTDILVNAPSRMTAAGFGDIIGKLIAKTDWHLSNTINGEIIHKKALETMDIAVSRCIKLVSEIEENTSLNTPELAEALMNGLVTAGVSMTMAGNSRPASASEHLISHFLGMKSLFHQAPHHLHGTKVAYGTYQMAKLYWKVFSMNFSDFRKIIEEGMQITDIEDEKRWEEYLKKAYGPLGSEKFIQWMEFRPDKERVETIIDTLDKNWEFLQQLVNNFIPSLEELREIYRRTGLPYTREKMGYSSQIAKEAMMCSKDFDYVNKYSLLHLLGELKILEKLIQE